ncbi:carboxylesterase family protein [Henriciella sp. AS95]|uniref:carboxylesterase family protein n=1 Tax=Henriciella sp. AS95 TaxID=3135782 RepID=UPI00317C6897
MKTIRQLMLLGASMIAATMATGCATAQAGNGEVQTTIDAGVITGTEVNGVERYLGVPFAKPPVGDLRWKPPVPPTPWGETAYDATEYKLPCYQATNPDGVTLNLGGVAGPTSEDCLYLNVYAPADADGSAPVMLWFYGGGNVVGAGNLSTYDGQSFAEDGVVIVTMNYRLGAAGWFAHPALTEAADEGEPLVSYGSMDQTEALRWIQRNISAFGGDKDNVTIFGQSAGGYGVYAQLMSPTAEGLFDKAMVHSATYIRPSPEMDLVELRGIRRATEWGLDGANATLEEMRAVPIETLGRGVGGAVDGVYFKEPWINSIAYKRHALVPFVVGGNDGEGALWARDRWIAEQFEQAGEPAFQYHFSHVREGLDESRGAIHSAELQFAWDTLDPDQANPPNQAVADAMHPCWVAFAFYDGEGPIDCGNGIVWPAFTETQHPVLEFTTGGPVVHQSFRSDEEWVETLRTQ